MGISKIGTLRYKGFICTHHKYEILTQMTNQPICTEKKIKLILFVFTRTFVLEK